MLEKVKLALRLTTDAFDAELNDLIDGAIADLEHFAGIQITDQNDPLIVRAVVTYCRANFGSPSDYDRVKAAYDEQKAQMLVATGYGIAEEG